LIVEEGPDDVAHPPRPTVDRTAGELLEACVAEMARHAAALDSLDAAVGKALCAGTDTEGIRTLQGLDLLRQEALGLSRLLRLVAAAESLDDLLRGETVAECLPIGAQLSRLMS
jgi:hypothetical protein